MDNLIEWKHTRRSKCRENTIIWRKGFQTISSYKIILISRRTPAHQKIASYNEKQSELLKNQTHVSPFEIKMTFLQIVLYLPWHPNVLIFRRYWRGGYFKSHPLRLSSNRADDKSDPFIVQLWYLTPSSLFNVPYKQNNTHRIA